MANEKKGFAAAQAGSFVNRVAQNRFFFFVLHGIISLHKRAFFRLDYAYFASTHVLNMH